MRDGGDGGHGGEGDEGGGGMGDEEEGNLAAQRWRTCSEETSEVSFFSPFFGFLSLLECLNHFLSNKPKHQRATPVKGILL